jgi:MoxR-like ATPase
MDRVDVLHTTVLESAVTKEEILEAREIVNQIYVDDKAKDYIVDIVQATRNPEQFGLDIGHLIEYGASPRATIYLQQASRALAFMQGEGNVFPNDVKQVAMDILRHRVMTSYEAEAEEITSEDVIRKILDTVPVP